MDSNLFKYQLVELETLSVYEKTLSFFSIPKTESYSMCLHIWKYHTCFESGIYKHSLFFLRRTKRFIRIKIKC